MSQIQGAIAATRFGMGAKPGEIAEASSDPRGWLKQQIRAEAAIVPADGLMSVEQVFKERREAYEGMAPGAASGGAPADRRELRAEAKGKGKGKAPAAAAPTPATMPPDLADDPGGNAKSKKSDAQRTPQQMIQQQIRRESEDGLQQEIAARERFAYQTNASFADRWARFWSNHFTVAARNAQLIGIVGPFEREAIRPHVFGTFARLVGASTFHPTMLVYLDANRSIGPSTEAAKRRDAGLNENLAREIMELHTMGVGSGYTQADIIEFAKALTGWTVGNAGPGAGLALGGGGKGGPVQNRLRNGGGIQQQLAALRNGMEQNIGKTVFAEPLHEPGARTVLGKKYGGDGKTQAASILDDLVKHPATARHIATKLVRHFVADTPPPAAVAKIETAFNRSGGDLATVAAAVIDLDEAWAPVSVKFKTPEDLLVSTARSCGQDFANRVGGKAGANKVGGGGDRAAYVSLAQQPFSAPSPAGWPDDTVSWSGSDAVMKRLEWANTVSARLVTRMSPNDFLDTALGPLASDATRKAVSRAETAQQGFTLALMSPEFQRR